MRGSVSISFCPLGPQGDTLMRLLRLSLSLLALSGGGLAAAEADDPVAELERVLVSPPGKAAGKEALQARRKKLEALVGRLSHPADLCRAAALPGWRKVQAGPAPDVTASLAKLHQEARQKLGDRLAK